MGIEIGPGTVHFAGGGRVHYDRLEVLADGVLLAATHRQWTEPGFGAGEAVTELFYHSPHVWLSVRPDHIGDGTVWVSDVVRETADLTASTRWKTLAVNVSAADARAAAVDYILEHFAKYSAQQAASFVNESLSIGSTDAPAIALTDDDGDVWELKFCWKQMPPASAQTGG